MTTRLRSRLTLVGLGAVMVITSITSGAVATQLADSVQVTH